MADIHSLDLWLLLVLGVALLVSYGAWRNRPRRGSKTLTAYMLTLAVAVTAHLLAHQSSGALEFGLIIARIVGLFSLAFFLLAFTLAYTGRDHLLTRRGLALIFAAPACYAAFLLTPTVTGLFGPAIGSDAVSALFDESGVAFYLPITIAYGVLFVSSALLIQYSYQVNALFRRTGLAIVGGLVAMWLMTVIELSGLVEVGHVHWVQNGFLVMGIVFLWAVFRGGLTDLTPVARSTIIQTLSAGVLVVDSEGRLTDVNPAARDLLGYGSEEQLVGRPVSEVLSDHETLGEHVRNREEGVVELSTDPDRWVVSVDVNPLTGAKGRRIGDAIVLYDITEQRRQQEQLERQNERLEQFGSMVSHDLRNPLTIAMSYLEHERETRDNDNLATIDDALNRIKTLIEDLRELTRQGQPIDETNRVTLERVAEDAWSMVDTREADLAIEGDIAFDADYSRVVQLLENLFRNAVEHGSTSPESGLSIRVGRAGEDGFYVADDGVGIPEADREQIFETGYSTDPDGTGLGLAIVSEIVEAHGWQIRAAESEDGGTRFEITGLDVQTAEAEVAP